MSLDKDIEKLFGIKELSEKDRKRALSAFREMVKLLNKGEVRSAEKRDGVWFVQ